MQKRLRVTVMALAAGVTWGVGTVILLFYNGVILGADAVPVNIYSLGGGRRAA